MASAQRRCTVTKNDQRANVTSSMSVTSRTCVPHELPTDAAHCGNYEHASNFADNAGAVADMALDYLLASVNEINEAVNCDSVEANS
jgi:hypothetical protein